VEKLVALTEKKPKWQSPLLQQHHLVGRIWRPSDGRFVDQEVMAEDLVRSAYVLLGEKHDNADHHLLQARMIELLTSLGRRPAVIWEMITESKQPILDQHFATYSRDAKALGDDLGWNLSGWPAWQIYQPVAEAAMAAHLPMYAAGLPKSAVRSLARGKPSFKFAKRQRTLGLHIALPEELRKRSIEQLFQGHCEMMPRSALGPLFNVQRARDAVLGEHMLTSSRRDGALLIAGTGHVRKDFGVPLFLERNHPGIRITTVALVEVQDGLMDPTDYSESFSAPVMPFDYVWFTPRADDKDHCAALRKKWAKPAGEKPPPAKPQEEPAAKAKAEPEAAPKPEPTPEPKPEPEPTPEQKAAQEPEAKEESQPAPKEAEETPPQPAQDNDAKPENESSELPDLEEQEVEERKPVEMKPAEPVPGMPPIPRTKPPRPGR
jgi:uncharacterized iron-regulated protein